MSLFGDAYISFKQGKLGAHTETLTLPRARPLPRKSGDVRERLASISEQTQQVSRGSKSCQGLVKGSSLLEDSLSNMRAKGKFSHMAGSAAKLREFGFTHVESNTLVSPGMLNELIGNTGLAGRA